MKHNTFFNYGIIDPQPEQAEENPIFNYRCRPKTQKHSPFSQNKPRKTRFLTTGVARKHRNTLRLTVWGASKVTLDELEVRLSGQCRNTWEEV